MYDMIFEGDLIVSNGSGKVYKVTKVNPSNYRCVDEKGGVWNVRRSGARKAPEGTVFEAPEAPKVTLGTAIKFTGKSATKFPGIFVVCALQAGDKARFAKLGGDGGRYVTGSLYGVELVDEINNFNR